MFFENEEVYQIGEEAGDDSGEGDPKCGGGRE